VRKQQLAGNSARSPIQRKRIDVARITYRGDAEGEFLHCREITLYMQGGNPTAREPVSYRGPG